MFPLNFDTKSPLTRRLESIQPVAVQQPPFTEAPAQRSPLQYTDPPKPATFAEGVAAISTALADVINEQGGAQLYLEWDEMRQRIEAFLRKHREQDLSMLRAQLEETRAAGRAAKEELESLNGELRTLEGTFNRLEEDASKARLALKQAQAARPNDDAWPTHEEMLEWEQETKRLGAEADRRNEKVNELQKLLNAKHAEVRDCQQRLRGLRARRDDLKAQLEGKPPKGPLGLVGPTAEHR